MWKLLAPGVGLGDLLTPARDENRSYMYVIVQSLPSFFSDSMFNKQFIHQYNNQGNV